MARYLIKHSSTDACMSLLEIVLNTLNGNIPISKHFKTKLEKFKKSLRKLINPKISVLAKRKTLLKIHKIIKLIVKNFYTSPISKQFKNEYK